MLQAQTERSVIIAGIVLCVAGALTEGNGVWAWQSARRFQTTALRTTATVVPSENPRGAVRFTTEQGIVETPLPRGHHEPLGTALKILYEPGNPQRWTMEPGYGPDYGLGLARVGVLMLIGGPMLLTIASVSRRRNRRPFWQ